MLSARNKPTRFTLFIFTYCISILSGNYGLKLTNVQKLASDAEKAASDILTNFGRPTTDRVVYPNRWISALIEQVDEDLENNVVAKIASINDVTLTAELLSLADGFHLILPHGEREVENQRRITAIAITSMLMDLSTMERVDAILANCSLRSTVNVLFTDNGTVKESHLLAEMMKNAEADNGAECIEKIFAHWLQSITAVLENDPHLKTEFAARRHAAEIKLARESTDGGPIMETVFQAGDSAVEEKLAKRMAHSRIFRLAAVNRIFLRHASKHLEPSVDATKSKDGLKYFLLTRAILDLATHHGERDRLNELYQKMLTRVIEDISVGENNMEELRHKIFLRLENMVEEDDELCERVKGIERNLYILITFRTLRRNIALI